VFFFLSKLLDVFLSPLTWGLIFFALAVPWRRPPRHRSRWRWRRVAGIAGLAILIMLSTEMVSNRLRYALEHANPSSYRPDVNYDVVILLGGVSDERVAFEEGQPSYNDNVERLVATHRVLADGHARFAIVSGAASDPALIDTNEARMLARQIVQWGRVEPSQVIIEEQARNTRENATYSQRIAKERGFEKVLIITSAFHMRRSIECFEAVGMKVDTLHVDYRAHSSKSPGSDSLLPRVGSLHDSSQVIREFTGLYIYRLQGYAKPL
jgi:uncharacterized SAM-binding protein YcdF (DUF218 family)